MNKMKVYIESGEDEIETTKRILEKAKPKIGNKVLIKPNITMPFSDSAICTSPKVVEGIVSYLRSIGIEDIVIGEGASGALDMAKHFDVAGYTELSSRLGIPIINLNRDEEVRLKIKNPNSLEEISVAKAVVERYVINVPKMKTHRMAGISLAMKNMMGVILPYNGKLVLHPLYEKLVRKALDEKRNLTRQELSDIQNEFFARIIDFHSVYKPQLNIIDGFVAREGDGLNLDCGRDIKMNCVLLSESIPAIDYVASKLMGLNPKQFYLRQMPDFNSSQVEVVSNKALKSLTKKFRPTYLTERIIVY